MEFSSNSKSDALSTSLASRYARDLLKSSLRDSTSSLILLRFKVFAAHLLIPEDRLWNPQIKFQN
jgi:hypothetical protein